VWPAGIVGAITHTDGFAAAVVARATDTAGVGLDSERILTTRSLRTVREEVATPGEMDALGGSSLGEAVLLTLVFSAKETLFKSLYRLVGRYFDFQDAAIVEVGDAARRFTVELRADLGGFAAGGRFGGRFAIVHGVLHTGLTLPP